ncbi:MAG: metallophosphoesterase, partial [Rubrivivax sp.]|nr:metallophosphoesterase [Rubrivivax sp.]
MAAALALVAMLFVMVRPLPALAQAGQAGQTSQTSQTGQTGQTGQVQWHGVERVVAFADVHGAHTELVRLLRETGIVDEKLRWAAGATHVVSLGDLLDRGADSRQVMDLLMRLQGEAQAAGGRLHVVLGNHEAMNLLGDLRDVHIGEYAAYADVEPAAERAQQRQAWVAAQGDASAAAFDQRFPPGYFGHRQALSPDGRYGQWLLSLPVAIKVNDTLFMHAGPSNALRGMTLQEVNLRYRTALTSYLGLAARLEREKLLQAQDVFHHRARLARERFGRLMAAMAASAGAGAGHSTVDAALGDVVTRFEQADDH